MSHASRSPAADDVEQRILDLLRQRDAGKSICPSEVARSFVSAQLREWRGLMPSIRDAAATLAQKHRIIITRGAETVDPRRPITGAVRLRRGRAYES